MDTELSERVRGRELRRARQMDIEGAKGRSINDVRNGRGRPIAYHITDRLPECESDKGRGLRFCGRHEWMVPNGCEL